MVTFAEIIYAMTAVVLVDLLWQAIRSRMR